jgi:hypothetical protein
MNSTGLLGSQAWAYAELMPAQDASAITPIVLRAETMEVKVMLISRAI